MNVLALGLALILAAETPASLPAQSAAILLRDMRAIACGDELGCWKRKTLKLDLGLDSAAVSLEALTSHLGFSATEIALWKGKATDTQRALDAIKPTSLTPYNEPWHRAPVLWFALGFVSAIALALGVFAVAKRIDIVAP